MLGAWRARWNGSQGHQTVRGKEMETNEVWKTGRLSDLTEREVGIPLAAVLKAGYRLQKMSTFSIIHFPIFPK